YPGRDDRERAAGAGGDVGRGRPEGAVLAGYRAIVPATRPGGAAPGAGAQQRAAARRTQPWRRPFPAGTVAPARGDATTGAVDPAHAAPRPAGRLPAELADANAPRHARAGAPAWPHPLRHGHVVEHLPQDLLARDPLGL